MSRSTKKQKFIFITGGVASSLGKGIAAASIGLLMKSRGLNSSDPDESALEAYCRARSPRSDDRVS